jgi:hypothetical protein
VIIKDILGDPHCSMDRRSQDRWLLDHVREEAYPYKLYIETFDKIAYERRHRETYPVMGTAHLDTKRYRVELNGVERTVRKIEYLTCRAGVWSEEDPQATHEWHRFWLVFDEEDYIVEMIQLEGAVVQNRPMVEG